MLNLNCEHDSYQHQCLILRTLSSTKISWEHKYAARQSNQSQIHPEKGSSVVFMGLPLTRTTLTIENKCISVAETANRRTVLLVSKKWNWGLNTMNPAWIGIKTEKIPSFKMIYSSFLWFIPLLWIRLFLHYGQSRDYHYSYCYKLHPAEHAWEWQAD